MQHQDGYIENIEKTPIYFQTWIPRKPIKAAMLIVHGLGEHSGRYENLVQRFVAQGFIVYGYDHIGHGHSSGRRCHIANFNCYLKDLDLVVHRIKAANPEIPLVLFGHSMGGLISASYLVEHQNKISAAVLSSPAIEAPDTVPAILLKVGQAISKLWPRLGVIKLDAEGICRNSAVVEAYEADSLVHHGKISARLGQALLEQMQWLKQQMMQIHLPLLVIQGEHDSLVDPKGAKQLVDGVGSKIKKLIMYKGLYHELINEPEREVVLNDIELWIRERLCLYASQDCAGQYKKIS